MKRRAFTLIELLVVIFIVLLISAVAIPVVNSSMRQGQVAKADQILRNVIAGAKDDAMVSGEASGLRFLPDAAFPITYLPNGQIDYTQPLASNRVIPIRKAPDYSEGRLNVVRPDGSIGGAVGNEPVIVSRADAYRRVYIYTAFAGGPFGRLP